MSDNMIDRLLKIDLPDELPIKEVKKEEVEVEDEFGADLFDMTDDVSSDSTLPTQEELDEQKKNVDRIREQELKKLEESNKKMMNSGAFKEANYSPTSDSYDGDTSNAPADAKEDVDNSSYDKDIQILIQKDVDKEELENKNNLPWNTEYKFSDGRVLKINNENRDLLLNKLPEYGTIVHYWRSKTTPLVQSQVIHGPVQVTLGAILADVPPELKGTLKNDIAKMKGFEYEPAEENKGVKFYASVGVDIGKGYFTTNHGRTILARSGNGKDSNVETMIKNKSVAATKEGFLDRLLIQPANLFLCPELSDFFVNDKSYSNGIIYAFKEYAMQTDMPMIDYSHNGKNPIRRVSPYIAPSMLSKTQNSSWFTLLQKNDQLKHDGTMRRSPIDMLDEEEITMRIVNQPTLPEYIIHKERKLPLNDSIEPILDIYKKFRCKLKLPKSPDRLIELKINLKNGLNKQLKYEPFMKNTRLEQWGVIEHWINMQGLKYYFIFKPYLDNSGEYDINDNYVWDCVIMQMLYDMQMLERCVYCIQNKCDDYFNSQIDKLKGMYKKYNIKLQNVAKIHNHKWLKDRSGHSLSTPEVIRLCQNISDLEVGFYYNKKDRIMAYQGDID